MTKAVNIQFHMLFNELIDFVADMIDRHGMELELERYFPEASTHLPGGINVRAAVSDFGHLDRVWFLFKPSGKKKVERFMLNVGRVRGNRLEQSQFGAAAKGLEAANVLRAIALDLKGRTREGVWVVTEAGNVAYDKKFRISVGAEAASRTGDIELTAVGFVQTFHADEPHQGTRTQEADTVVPCPTPPISR